MDSACHSGEDAADNRVEGERMSAAVRSRRSSFVRFCTIAAVAVALCTTAAVADPPQSIGEALSGDGRFVVFMSNRTDLVPGQVDTNGGFDVFLRDRFARTTTLVSHTAGSLFTAASRGVGSY